MLYYDTNERKGRRAGAVAAAVYLVVVFALMWVIKFDMTPEDYGEGILIDFGNSESASGLVDPANATAQSTQASAPNHAPEEIMTQDFEEAPEVHSQVQPSRQQSPQPVTQPNRQQSQQPQQQSQTPVQEPPRQANPLLNFPGMTQGSTSASEGSAAEGAGNQGSLEGSPGGSHDGTGGGGSGHSFSLAGRSIMGRLPEPVQGRNKAGRVVVEIVVDPAGNVVSAALARGSLTLDGELVNAAIAAAYKAKFDVSDKSNNQRGTITYNFRLN